jgi:hypothetical protein
MQHPGQIFFWKDDSLRPAEQSEAGRFGEGRLKFRDSQCCHLSATFPKRGRFALNSDQINVLSVSKLGLPRFCTARYG